MQAKCVPYQSLSILLSAELRTKEELDDWKQRDPVRLLRERAVSGNESLAQQLDDIDVETQRWLQDAVEFGRTSPEPDPATALDFVC